MKSTPVKGTRDYLPKEVEIRDYLQNIIAETYRDAGFVQIGRARVGKECRSRWSPYH